MKGIFDIENPLVSIVVITFNSAKYVLETLESIQAQKYQNIELIIADDCSKDNTIAICGNWMNENKARFVRTELIIVPANTGIPSNCNRGVKAAQGDWVKLIAGDDLLLKTCIQKNVAFVLYNKCEVVFSKRITFKGDAKNPNVLEISRESIFNEPALTATHQYQLTLRSVGCPPNTLFYSKRMLNAVGYFDEAFKLIEDWPMNIRMTKAGYKIYYMPEETFLYRVNEESVFHNNTHNLIYNDWGFTSVLPVFKKYVFPYLGFWETFFVRYSFVVTRVIYNTPLNNRNLFTRIVNYALLVPCNLNRNYAIKKLKRKIIEEIGGVDKLDYV
jgi:glycosyltransferase involved in cell wall biosynthesis